MVKYRGRGLLVFLEAFCKSSSRLSNIFFFTPLFTAFVSVYDRYISVYDKLMAKQSLVITSAKHSNQKCPNKIAGHTNTVTPSSVGNA